MSAPLQDLAARCGQLSSVELFALAEQIDQAQGMLANSLGVLREAFAAFAAHQTGVIEPREPFDHAMIALQSEDMVGQLLDHTRGRIARLAKLARLQDQLISDLIVAVAEHCHDPAKLAEFHTRFASHADALTDLSQLRQPVKDSGDDTGPVQLF